MPAFFAFCSRCGASLDEKDRSCACCGAEAVDANIVTVLKRTSARRSRRGRDEEPPEDNLFPL